MITPEQVREDIRCLRKVRDNVGALLLRKHPIIAKGLLVMHKANPVVAARIADDLMFLDAVLYHAWFIKYAPEVLDGTKKESDFSGFFGLPLRQLPNNRYAASCGFYDQFGQNIEYWTKKPDFMGAVNGEYFDAGKATKINTSSGTERSFRMPCVIRQVGDISFFGYGTISKVEELISLIPAVGKKPALGWGAIRDFEITPQETDMTTWTEEYGIMRPIPVDEYAGIDEGRYHIRDCGIRPPFWKAKNQETCYIPEVSRLVDD